MPYCVKCRVYTPNLRVPQVQVKCCPEGQVIRRLNIWRKVHATSSTEFCSTEKSNVAARIDGGA